MIEKKTVCQIVDEWLAGKDYFLVEVTISPDDKILVEIDHKEGVWIEDCVELSRYIESKLNREDEDYELEVGSAGIGQPFKVLQQYINHIGKEVEVLTKDGRKLSGGRVEGSRRTAFRRDHSEESERGRCQASQAGGRGLDLYV